MVYIHFPANCTEEEQMLKTKYQKLKKKVCSDFTYFLFILLIVEKSSTSFKSTKTRT